MKKTAKKTLTKRVVPTVVRHNKGMAIAVLVFLFFVGCVYGMASKVPSIMNPGQKVTRPELQAELTSEVQRLKGLAEARSQELDRQDKIKQDIVSIGLMVAEGGAVNPMGLLGYGLGLFGLGATIDNKLKDTVIKKKDAEAK